MCFSSTAKHHGTLKGGGPPLWSVRIRAVSWPLASEKQWVFPVVQLLLEELVLLMWQLDAQHSAPVCGGQVPFHAHLPASCQTTLPSFCGVQKLDGGLVHGCGSHLGHLEDDLKGSWYFGEGVPLSVVAQRSQGESGLGAGGVGVVPVGAFPHVLAGIKGEVASEEEYVGTGFAVLADPVAGQRQGNCGAGGQHRGALL